MHLSARIAPALALALAHAAIADTVTLPAAADNTLYETSEGSASNGQGPQMYVGVNNGSTTRRGLIRFDLSTIPAGSTITAVTLNMYMNRTITGGVDIGLHRATASWGEGESNAGDPGGNGVPPETGDATWRHRFYPLTFWTNRGGDFLPTASSLTFVEVPGPVAWPSTQALVADVQGWVDNPANNFGWVLKAAEELPSNVKRFGTRENTEAAERPFLVVTFTPPSAGCPGTGPGACAAGDWNEDGTIDFNDLLAFLNDYNAATPCSDVNEDGATDFNDLLEYLNRYNTGC